MAENLFSTLGSIVGIGVGSIEIFLVSPSVRTGDTVHGRAQLKLTRKTDAKRLVCGVEAVEERVREVSDGRGGRTRERERHVLHRFEQQLDGARSYLDEAYDLHLPVPAQPVIELPSGVLGDMARFVSAVKNMQRPPISWSVYVLLDIPWKANIHARVDLAVR